MMAYAMLRFDQHTPLSVVAGALLLPRLAQCWIIACAQPGTWVGKLLATPVLVGIGLISYSAYPGTSQCWPLPVTT